MSCRTIHKADGIPAALFQSINDDLSNTEIANFVIGRNYVQIIKIGISTKRVNS